MADAAVIETWTLYSVGVLIILARIYSRWQMVGPSNFKPDDYMIFFTLAIYTGMTVAAEIVGEHGDLGAIPTDQRLSLTQEQADSLILGTKWFMVGWYTYVSLIWSLKFNMLFLYQRVVNGLWVAKFIKPTLVLVMTTWIAILLLVSFVCRPYERMWQVWPDPGSFCKAQGAALLIPTLICNLITDLCIMLIPAPVIFRIRTTIWRRIGLYILFGAGVFVMVAAVLRVVFVLGLKNGKTAAIWSCREDVVAIFVGQSTMIRPVFTRKFWTGEDESTKGVSKRSASSKNGQVSIELAQQTIGGGNRKGSAFRSKKDPYAMSAMMATMQESDSTEKIIESASAISGGAGGSMESGRPVDVESGGHRGDSEASRHGEFLQPGHQHAGRF
ncbi:hypothetical protein BFW01_g5788 [Lasiodiplodia theobromae]|uniref:Rhodopsin domain-containing protein n=1 Tax=Lasiodiplodia theobromae TaxID=45133 RepID=A0A5N5CWT7_9PEZI|nr:uncharacterized protein LTHEOB_548 [Lasiodiplodia theobromae]KAB2569801.1 hypothetical protein DBV05_g11535 [Lasiodiplodia theobromae]KAF4540606.1 hypothetical protein LTHEOB_548 [Lasiodiplodia theobromae]KAF9634893.1 hypothetical protein BFW01_g5788 [Lasiodiplodia theobromae]